MTDALAELRALSEAATAGEWRLDEVGATAQRAGHGRDRRTFVTSRASRATWERHLIPEDQANAALIVAAVNLVRRLTAPETLETMATVYENTLYERDVWAELDNTQGQRGLALKAMGAALAAALSSAAQVVDRGPGTVAK